MKKPTYEKIRHLTVGELKSYPHFVLKCMENEIKKEIERATLVLAWIKNIHALKSDEEMEGQNGK